MADGIAFVLMLALFLTFPQWCYAHVRMIDLREWDVGRDEIPRLRREARITGWITVSLVISSVILWYQCGSYILTP